MGVIGTNLANELGHHLVVNGHQTFSSSVARPGAALAFGARPPLSSGMAPSAPSPRAAPKFAYIRVEAKPSGGSLAEYLWYMDIS
jgi:hypothetical protein